MTAPPSAAPTPPAAGPAESFDVVVVGAGLSGVAAGYHLQTQRPGSTYTILEARGAIGGTWDLFRYPGLRSDSDMQTYGYAFEPWTGDKAIADGSSILDYVRHTAAEHGIDRHVQFHRRVTHASWSSTEARWTLDVERTDTGGAERVVCRFLLVCGGYYDYDHGYSPPFAGSEAFQGRIVHPQFWPEGLDWTDQRVVVVGSGATAVTLVPALAKTAAHVTMLQRSPTYIVSQPATDPVSNWLRSHLPARAAYAVSRAKNVAVRTAMYAFSRRRPERAKQWLVERVQRELGPDFDVATHFTPSYDPWDQRICLVPDSDLFDAIRSGAASVVTDHVEAFTETGLRLRSGTELAADLVVTATGLNVVLMGGIGLDVDGEPVDLAECLVYRGVLLSGVPNFASVFGYTNTSWTLKADLSCDYVCRLLDYLDGHGYDAVVAPRDVSVGSAPFLDFRSGYVERVRDALPRQGTKSPWRNTQNYLLDSVTMRHGRINDGVLRFIRRPAR